MSLTLSEYLLRDFTLDRVDATVIDFGSSGNVRFPAISQAYFHLVLAGTARLKVDDAAEPLELPAGHFAFLLYGAGHSLGRNERRYWSTSPHTLNHWEERDELQELSLSGQPGDVRVLSGRMTLARMLRNSPSSRALPHVLRSRAQLFTDLVPIENACRGPGSTAFVFRLAQILMVQLLRDVHEDFKQLMPVHLGSTDMGRIAVIVRRMREHPEKRWTVASLAQEVGCSRSSFAAKFHAYAGLGPIRFAARTRLAHAQAMLTRNPELPLWEVAKRVGYDAHGSFTRAFKDQFGVSPRRYVRQLQSKSSNKRSSTESGATFDAASQPLTRERMPDQPRARERLSAG